jgi:hypothetical protein
VPSTGSHLSWQRPLERRPGGHLTGLRAASPCAPAMGRTWLRHLTAPKPEPGPCLAPEPGARAWRPSLASEPGPSLPSCRAPSALSELPGTFGALRGLSSELPGTSADSARAAGRLWRSPRTDSQLERHAMPVAGGCSFCLPIGPCQCRRWPLWRALAGRLAGHWASGSPCHSVVSSANLKAGRLGRASSGPHP